MALAGWIKLHRALVDHPIASDPQAFTVWVHLLLMANHRETKRMLGGKMIRIMPGQLVTSRKTISEKTGVQESKVERILKLLKTEQQIEQVGTAKYRVISIVNWASYQGDEQVNEQQMNSKRTADEQQMNTPGECKELQNEENQNLLSPDDDGAKCAQRIPYEEIRALYAEHLPTLPQVRIFDDARKKAIKSRWNTDKRFQDLEFWKKFFIHVSKSDFLMGRTQPNPWHGCCFDWIFKPANFKKIVEGNYHNDQP